RSFAIVRRRRQVDRCRARASRRRPRPARQDRIWRRRRSAAAGALQGGRRRRQSRRRRFVDSGPHRRDRGTRNPEPGTRNPEPGTPMLIARSVHPLPGEAERKERLLSLVDGLSSRRLLVIGDLIADEFIYGEVARVSREAPVLILKYDATEMVGG